mmetsp:Transcript_4314/g.9009  ORF Transcript_4314/g.9009 Transcript_4314/m.9009 type:complete len:89 (+) Transcript_4314:65-331(+)
MRKRTLTVKQVQTGIIQIVRNIITAHQKHTLHFKPILPSSLLSRCKWALQEIFLATLNQCNQTASYNLSHRVFMMMSMHKLKGFEMRG